MDTWPVKHEFKLRPSSVTELRRGRSHLVPCFGRIELLEAVGAVRAVARGGLF